MILLLLKIIMFFVAAIWGIVMGVLMPVGMLIFADAIQDVPSYIPLLWLTALIAGFIAPCFLVKIGDAFEKSARLAEERRREEARTAARSARRRKKALDPKLSEPVKSGAPIKLKLYTIAAALCIAGSISIMIVHLALTQHRLDGAGWFYLPLFLEAAAVVGMAIIEHAERIREKHDAPAPSILGKLADDGGKYKMRTFEDESSNKRKRKKNT